MVNLADTINLKLLRGSNVFPLPAEWRNRHLRGEPNEMLMEDLLLAARERDVFNSETGGRRTHERGIHRLLQGCTYSQLGDYWGVCGPRSRQIVYNLLCQGAKRSELTKEDIANLRRPSMRISLEASHAQA